MNEIAFPSTKKDFYKYESRVRSYSRIFNAQFDKAKDSLLYDANGRKFIDLLSGCGSLNYGHNNDALKGALMKYLSDDSISMSLDLATTSRFEFLEAFKNLVLEANGLDYLVQFTGPTGANAIEAAIKLARKTTGRSNVIAFTNGFHGCTLGALGLTASKHHRGASAALSGPVTRMPYDGYLGPEIDTAALLEKMLQDPSGGIDEPAAIVVETIQGEGGLNASSLMWMQKLACIAEDNGAVLIVDDIQAGCGRSGSFFSFHDLGLRPGIVTLAKSISGYGLPMSLVLIDPSLDRWSPGEHNGTFRGNNLAFVTATAALKKYWVDDRFAQTVKDKSEVMAHRLDELALHHGLVRRGRGMMQGLAFSCPRTCAAVRNACFQRGLVMETCGPHDEVLKFLPALTMSFELLEEAISTVADVLDAILEKHSVTPLEQEVVS